MILENWLHEGALTTRECPPLTGKLKTDCLVIGGGFAGLHAALRLVDAGKRVVLLEKTICGGSASGKSGGFLTPESEEDLQKLIKSVGIKEAKLIYDIPLKGVDLIVATLKKNRFKCDFRKQDSLFLSIRRSHDCVIEEEAETRKNLGFPYKLFDAKTLKKVHPGKGYTRGMRYPGSYGINSFMYAQEMKALLLKKGVRIFENSEVHKLIGTTAVTNLGMVTADNIVVCMDKMKQEFNQEVSKQHYHFQAYLAVSEPLSAKEMKALFPSGELMCWDTRWNYMYYRPVQGNRLLVGGSTLLTSYFPTQYESSGPIKSFIKELKYRFPAIAKVNFPKYWMGLMDVTKDLTPIVDYDKNKKAVQYVLGCAGLPWAAFCGDYAARRIVDASTPDLSKYLGMDRKFFIPNWFQAAFGKIISFGLSHLRELLK